ncbi:MAG: hypothetical protein ACXVCY_16840 [Pseudobdellovibrionaceae bacterium]
MLLKQVLTVKSSDLFQKVDSGIQSGNLKQARQLLMKVGSLKKLNEKEILTYFRLMRRVGEFEKAALQIEKLGMIYPSLKMERASFLGECGALHQALELLKESSSQFFLSNEDELQRLIQLGNFYSLRHQYDEAIEAYQKLENEALRCSKKYLALVGRLNVFGHMIYANKYLDENILNLQKFISEELEPFPLLKQGAFYFISLAEKKLCKNQQAIESIKKAYEVGVTHRLRESLLLELTAFELEPLLKSKTEISRLRKKVLEQVHIIYFDQFNKIMASRSWQEGQSNTAKKYLNKVLFGQRLNSHYVESVDLNRKYFNEIETVENEQLYWKIENQYPRSISKRQLIINKYYIDQLPLFKMDDEKYLLNEESDLIGKLSSVLIRNLDFPLRDAELWELVWQKPYNFITSPVLIRSTLSRWRKTRMQNFAKLTVQDRRIKMELKKGAQFILC